MNNKAIFEIGNIIHVRYSLIPPKTLMAKDIIQTYEYKIFKKQNPELCRLVEE